MKFRKYRIIPVFIVAVAVMVLVVSLAGSYIARISMDNFRKDFENYDTIVEKTAQMLEQNLTSKKTALQSYTYGFENVENEKESLVDLLSKFQGYGVFQMLAVIDINGHGYNHLGSEIEASDYFRFKDYSADDWRKTQIIGVQEEDKKIINTAPVFVNGELKYILLGFSDAKIDAATLGDDFYNGNNVLYVLDSEEHVVAYCSDKQDDFNYQTIDRSDIYSTDEFYFENKLGEKSEDVLAKINSSEMRKRFLEEKDNKEDNIFNQLVGSYRYISHFSNNEGYFWYEKQIFHNFLVPWKVLVGKEATITSESLAIFEETTTIMIYISATFVAILLFMIILQIGNSRKMTKIAYWDTVTEHGNWNRFKVDGATLLKKHKQREYAMVAMDIDKFKLINDVHGTSVGDMVLSSISKVLKDWIQNKEVFARNAADQFNILMIYESRNELDRRLMVLNRRLSEEIRLQNIHFSYGVFLIHDYRLQIERMNVYAVMAKDTVKNTPEKMIGYFNNKIREDLLDEQEIEEMMGPALVNKEFKVFLQPKYSSDGKHVHGAEALVRWFSPSKGVVSPSAFIPTFERNYFIIRLDNYMLEEVCYLQRKWLDMGKTPVVISVNISRVHLTDENLIGDILHIVDKYMVPHKYIELELTESAFFDNKDVLVSTVKRLRAEGFVVSMDDFGSGYSSLNSLKDISLDVIKLDREFFDAMEDNSRSRIVIENTISMAKNLNLKIVAEGIETKEQVQFLHEIGCDLIQGFYFSKPMSVSDFEELMHYQ